MNTRFHSLVRLDSHPLRRGAVLFLTALLMTQGLLGAQNNGTGIGGLFKKDFWTGGTGKVDPAQIRYAKRPSFDTTNVQTLAIICSIPGVPDARHTNDPVLAGITKVLESSMEGELIESDFQLVAQSDVSKIVKQLDFGAQGFTDGETIKRAGKMLNASHILLADISGMYFQQILDENFQGVAQRYRIYGAVSMKLVDVETGQAPITAGYTGSTKVDSPGQAHEYVATIGKLIASRFQSPNLKTREERLQAELDKNKKKGGSRSSGARDTKVGNPGGKGE